MKKVAWKSTRRKREVEFAAATPAAVEDLDARVAVIQSLIPLGLERVNEELQAEVKCLAGPRYRRGPEDRRYYRWGVSTPMRNVL